MARRRPSALSYVVVLLIAVVLGLGAAAIANGALRTAPDDGPTDAAPSDASEASTGPTGPAEPATPSPTPSPTPTAFDATFTIVAAGDVLPHTTVLRHAETGDGGWDFSPLWDAVTPWISGADLAICHLEVPVAPEGVTPIGYPVFATPASIATDLREAGWDGCSTASNHSVDQGWKGIVATLDALDGAGLGHAGTARTEAEAGQPQRYVLQRGGQEITVAHISATYGTNGLPIPSDAPWSVQLIDGDQLVAQAQQARAEGADLVVASIHWGTEYADAPHSTQTTLAQRLADSGAIDLVIGHHPHVPQPMAVLDGGPNGNGMWVAYSLGNYISNQDANCCRPETATGVLLTATIDKPVDGPARVTGLEWTGTTVDRLGNQRVYALPDLLAERIEAPLLSLSRSEIEQRQQRLLAVVGTSPAPERTEPLTPTGDPAVVIPRAS